MNQAELGMPSREYFLHQDDQGPVNAYMSFMKNVITRLNGRNDSSIDIQIQQMVTFEKQIAEVSS